MGRFRVAVGNGFSGDTWVIEAESDEDATSQAEAQIEASGNNTGELPWRVLGVLPAR